MTDPVASPTADTRTPPDEPGWMEQHLARLQLFNAEMAQLDQNVQTVVERAQAKDGSPTVAPPSPVRTESSVSKPLTVRVDETVTALEEQIRSLTRNVSHLDRLI